MSHVPANPHHPALSALLSDFGITPPPPRPPRPLTPRQRRAIQLLSLGHTLTDTAAILRLHRYTLTRWLKNPLFQAELDRQLNAHLHVHVARATKRHTAPQSATSQSHFLPNEPTAPPVS